MHCFRSLHQISLLSIPHRQHKLNDDHVSLRNRYIRIIFKPESGWIYDSVIESLTLSIRSQNTAVCCSSAMVFVGPSQVQGRSSTPSASLGCTPDSTAKSLTSLPPLLNAIARLFTPLCLITQCRPSSMSAFPQTPNLSFHPAL